jgi:hypothetical protein
MLVVADKYVDTKDYITVVRALLAAARKRGTIFHFDVAAMMGLPPLAADSHVEVNQMLAEIAQNEHLQGRPILSALAIDTRNSPGETFFAIARRLGRLTGESPSDEQTFWREEVEAVYIRWGGKNGGTTAHPGFSPL